MTSGLSYKRIYYFNSIHFEYGERLVNQQSKQIMMKAANGKTTSVSQDIVTVSLRPGTARPNASPATQLTKKHETITSTSFSLDWLAKANDMDLLDEKRLRCKCNLATHRL